MHTSLLPLERLHPAAALSRSRTAPRLLQSLYLLLMRFACCAAERRAVVEPHAMDRPLVVQIASDDPEEFLAAALLAQDFGIDAVDLNLGTLHHDMIMKSCKAAPT